jgi:hypothetical protein
MAKLRATTLKTKPKWVLQVLGMGILVPINFYYNVI